MVFLTHFKKPYSTARKCLQSNLVKLMHRSEKTNTEYGIMLSERTAIISTDKSGTVRNPPTELQLMKKYTAYAHVTRFYNAKGFLLNGRRSFLTLMEMIKGEAERGTQNSYKSQQ